MKQSIHARRMARQHKRSKQQSKLNLVSLMDIFTILVFFLLVNSSEVEVLQTNKNIKLPESIAEKAPKITLVIMVSEQDILVGGRKVADVQTVLSTKKSLIEPLKKELAYLASRKPYRSEAEKQLGRDVTIMGNNTTSYALLKKIMTTCAQSEYRNISFAVTRVPDESEPIPDSGQGGAG